MQAVVELLLQMPRELRRIEIAGVNRKHVAVNLGGRTVELDEDFNHAVVFARRESKERNRMLPEKRAPVQAAIRIGLPSAWKARLIGGMAR